MSMLVMAMMFPCNQGNHQIFQHKAFLGFFAHRQVQVSLSAPVYAPRVLNLPDFDTVLNLPACKQHSMARFTTASSLKDGIFQVLEVFTMTAYCHHCRSISHHQTLNLYLRKMVHLTAAICLDQSAVFLAGVCLGSVLSVSVFRGALLYKVVHHIFGRSAIAATFLTIQGFLHTHLGWLILGFSANHVLRFKGGYGTENVTRTTMTLSVHWGNVAFVSPTERFRKLLCFPVQPLGATLISLLT